MNLLIILRNWGNNMLFLSIIMIFAPGFISVLVFEQMKGCEFSNFKRVAMYFMFAFLINTAAYAAIWIRGWEQISWDSDGVSDLYNVSFCLKYMALSLVAAVVIPTILGLVKMGKRK